MNLPRRPGELVAFVGAETLRTTCLQWSLSLLFFALELAFAFLLQRFLAALGLLSARTSVAFLQHLGLGSIVALILIVSAARMAVGFLRGVVDTRAIERFAHRLRMMVISNCLSATTVNSAATLTLFNQKIYTASMAIHSMQLLLWQGTLAAGLTVALTMISARLTLTMAVVIIVVAVIPARLLNRRLKASARLHAATFEQIMLHLGNVFRNFLMIRLYNLQKREEQRLQGHLREYSSLILQYHRYDALTGTVGPFMIAVSVLLIATAQHSTSAMDGGLVVPYLYLFFRLSQTLVPLVSNAARLAFSEVELRWTYEWWSAHRHSPTPAAELPRSQPLHAPIGWTLHGVSFGYPEHPLIIGSVSLSVPAGSLLRVHGPSGTGKSTFLALLAGERAPLSGSVDVTLDGESLPVSSAAGRMRDHLGYAGSEPFLFAGSILENVAYGLHTEPTAAQLEEAAAIAECGFVYDLPQQFEHRLDELGQGLSTGQKQRLSLMRALLRSPKALLLDEALSNVDAATEKRVLAALIARKHRCTVVFVSHREHSAIQADVVLDLTQDG